MKTLLTLAALAGLLSSPVCAETTMHVVDIPTRPGVMQRIKVLVPEKPTAAAILFAGGHGGLQIGKEGALTWGANNFLVRTQRLFAEKGVMTILIDAPSDRQSSPFLAGFRQKPEHVADVNGVIAWVREKHPKLPVWLVGTSRGTQSAAYVATELAGKPDGPDGLVLTATILSDGKGRAVLEMPLEKLKIPVLVLHHKDDGCSHCYYEKAPKLLEKLSMSRRKELLTFVGGVDKGDPCEALSHHGFNGLENDAVGSIVAWMTGK
ncbi:MAG: alpha/beta hydrolase [Desulfobulbaceae bacterium]|nr:alpha/beta hydrolase [Desulfobulbaceae bacterium]